jgi:ribonucleoside-diphosphate reductase beta chain
MSIKFNPNIEPILIEDKSRYTLFPLDPKYKDIFDLYTKSVKAFWTTEEIDFTMDNIHWKNKLNDGERFFIKNILAFFAASDGIVNENLILNFYNEIQISEIRQVYASQIFIEAIHNHTYSLMIDNLITNRDEKETLFKAIDKLPIVKDKASWAVKWITNGTFPERLLAFAIVEGIFFSGSFCAIFWLKERNLMPGLTQSNELISRDESLHCKTAILIYQKLIQKLPEKRVHELFVEAIKIEKKFITESIPVNLLGMNDTLMKRYIEYIGDYWLDKLGYSTLFNVSNPFPFMEQISLENKSNMHEHRVTEYTKASIKDSDFEIDLDF